MPSLFSKWIVVFMILFLLVGSKKHPIYVSVIELDQNSAENTLEISCKIFTNDFETTLRKTTSLKVDLLSSTDKISMNNLVKNYILNHLKIEVDGKNKPLHFIGYEQSEESIESYFQIEGIRAPKKIAVQDDILYDYNSAQMSIIHVNIDGKRKSSKLNNPDKNAVFKF